VAVEINAKEMRPGGVQQIDTVTHSVHTPEQATELVRRAKAGDDAAFGELFRRYQPRIFALVLHLTGNESDAEDITQEVFLRAYRSINKFAGRSHFFTWIYRIAVNRAYNVRRDATRRREVHMDDPRLIKALAADAQDSPRRAAQLRETYRRLLHALDRLPREMRATVVLVTLQGFNHAEAAIIQDCSAGTIAWRIHKARQRLRKALVKAPRCMTPAAHDPPLQALSSDLRELLEQCDLPALSPA